MTAKQAEKFGFIDFVDKSINIPVIKENMSLADIMNACHDLNKPIDNPKIENNMELKDLENKVENLNGKITAKDETISSLENKVIEKDTKIEEIENQVTEKDTEITELKAKVSEFEVKEVENAVKLAIDSGKFVEENKEDLTTQATEMGVENFSKMVDMIKLPKADAVGQIVNSTEPGDKKTKDQKLAEEYQNLAKNDSAELERIMDQEPKRFEEMEKAWNKY